MGAVDSLADVSLGVAFHPVTGDQDDVNVDEIRILDQWHDVGSLKVPSAISFSPTVRWGFNVDQGAGALVWTKLELEQQERRDELWIILTALVGMNNLEYSKIVESAGLPQYPTKDPVDIVAEYLSKVREHLVHTIQNDYSSAYLSTTIVDLVVTVPAVGGALHQSLGLWLMVSLFQGLDRRSQGSNISRYP